MIHLRPYAVTDAARWDEFVDRSINATFLLKRGYMDYHSDRFKDYSIVAEEDSDGHFVALLPACIVTEADGRKALSSHAGLTYGGWLLSAESGTITMMDLMGVLVHYLRRLGFSTLIYKQIPTIYHRVPAQADEYALWHLGARLAVCNIATTLDLRAPEAYTPRVQTRRQRGQKKAQKLGYTVRVMQSLSEFWPIVEENLRERYDTRPVHTRAEMELLMSRFPREIRCLVAEREGRVEGGILYYLAGPVVHIQYPHATPTGKDAGVMDLLYMTLIEQYRAVPEVRYFDFGTSNEDAGRYLNRTLVAQKEGFGGRGVAYRIFRLELPTGAPL